METSRSHTFALAAHAWAMETTSGPEPGWEKAHTPLPRDMGDEWVWLPHDLHQIHGLLQSEDMGRCCFYHPHTRDFLKSGFCKDWFKLWDLLDKWHTDQSRRGGQKSKPSRENAHKAGRTGKTWEIVSAEGEVIITNRLQDFCDSRGLNSSNMRQVAYGKRRHHFGYTARIMNTKHT